MSEWNIINSTGSVVATAKKVEYHGKLMEERYVTVDIDSPVRLDLRAGYYMLYRGDKFTLRDSGEIEKSARPQSYGGAFTYKGLKLVAQSWQELQDTEMTDYVYGPDNKMHYTGLGTFQFYVTKVSDMGYRVQAVMDNKYGTGKWVVKIGGIALTGSYSDVEVDDAKYISISSGTSVKETLDMLWTEWGYYYKVTSGMVGGELVHYVDICPNAGTALPLYYGKKRTETVAGQTRVVGGLVKIVRKINPNVEICTRLRAYGSERNLPYHWYNNKYGDQTDPYDPLRSMYIPQLMLPHTVAYYDEDGNYCDAEGNLYEQGDEGVVGSVNPWQYPNDVVLENVVSSALFGKRDKEVHWNSDDMGEIFPSMKGMEASDVTGLQTKTFRNQGALDRILSFDYESSSDTGSSSPIDVTSDKINFIVYVPNPGFNPADHNTAENVELLVQSGMCQARAFTIIKSEGCDSNGDPVTDDTGTVVQYKLTCAKVIDEEIDQVFPNSPSFEIVAGDYYVYTGLEFNGDYSQDTWLDVYVQAAEMRLLRAAALWLREHSSEDYIHEVSIDNVYMKTVPNISANLVEGAKVKIEDAQIGAYKTDIVESVTITEGKEAIPTYEITFLRRDESESLGDRVKGLVGQSISASSEIAKANDNLAKKVNKTGFHTLFDPLDAQYNVLDINGDLTNLKYIRANVDFFSIKGVAALGTTSGGGGGGGGGDLNALLDSINDSDIGDTMPTAAGQVITWNGSKWVFNIPEGGGGGGTGTVTSITAGTGLSGGTITTMGTIAISSEYQGYISHGQTAYGWGNHANAGYLTQSSLNGYATKTWVNQQGFLTSETYTGTVTSVGLSVPTGFTVSGSPITSSGTLSVSIATGYFIPTTTQRTTWNGKQDAISDLSTIRTNASHGETAYNSLSNYLPLAGGTMTGALHLGSASGTSPYIYWGDGTYVYIGEDSDDHMTIRGANGVNILTGSNYELQWNGAAVATQSWVNGRGYMLREEGMRFVDYGDYIAARFATATGGSDTARAAKAQGEGYIEWWSSGGYFNHKLGFLNANGSVTVGTSNTDTTHYIQIGGARLYWDENANSLYVQKYNGSPCNFYSLGGISALGATSGSGTMDIDVSKLTITSPTDGVVFKDSTHGDATLKLNDGGQFVINKNLISNGQIQAGSSVMMTNFFRLNDYVRFEAAGGSNPVVYLEMRTSTSGAWQPKATWRFS